MRRTVRIIVVNLCGLLAIAGVFIGIATIAGGFGAHTPAAKVHGGIIGFGSSAACLGLAFVTSGRDAAKMLDDLLTLFLINS